jgi:hypothetical protein
LVYFHIAKIQAAVSCDAVLWGFDRYGGSALRRG